MKNSKASSRRPRGGAFAFCTRIKDYKVLRKESKTLGNAMTRKVEQAVVRSAAKGYRSCTCGV